MTAASATLPVSEHFTLRRLADGVYAAVASGPSAMSNAGIVDLGGRTLVFDTMLTLPAARELRSAAEALTGRAAEWIVNSHWHDDHVVGNQAFAPTARVISTRGTRDLFYSRFIAELDESRRTTVPERVRASEAELAQTTDEPTRAGLQERLERLQAWLTAALEIEPRVPEVTFEHELTLWGDARQARLMTFGGGHTGSDAVLLLPDDGVLFTADLVANRTHPWLGHGDPANWLTILGRLDELVFHTLVPGHGEVGTRADIATVREYIQTTLRAAERGETQLSEPYADWADREVWEWNMEALAASAAG